MDVDAVVLAGGRARRLGGVDKPALADADGVRLLDHVLAAVDSCRRVVVVGPDRPGLPDGVLVVREEPPFAGPAAAVAAALPLLPGDGWVLMLAGDQPRAAAGVAALRAAAAEVDVAADVDGVVLVDDEGRRQWLCAAYRATSLRRAAAAVDAARPGSSLRDLLGGLSLRDLPDTAGASDDVDTPEDLSRWRRG